MAPNMDLRVSSLLIGWDTCSLQSLLPFQILWVVHWVVDVTSVRDTRVCCSNCLQDFMIKGSTSSQVPRYTIRCSFISMGVHEFYLYGPISARQSTISTHRLNSSAIPPGISHMRIFTRSNGIPSACCDFASSSIASMHSM